MKATIVGNGWLRQSEAALAFRFLTKFPESFSIARLLVPELIESFWEPFPQALGLLRLLDRLSYQRRIEKLSSCGYSRGRRGSYSPATREMHQERPLGGGRDLATSTLTSLTRNLRAKPCTGTEFSGLSLIRLCRNSSSSCSSKSMLSSGDRNTNNGNNSASNKKRRIIAISKHSKHSIHTDNNNNDICNNGHKQCYEP